MFRNDRTRLSPSAAEALETLREPVEQAEGLSHAAIVERLVEGEFEQAGARAVVSELLSKGYLYEVDGELHVTPG